MQRIGLLNGNNITYDKDNTAGLLASLTAGVISGFGITGSGAGASIQSGNALIECTRSNGEKIMLYFENTADVAVDLSGTKKVYILVDQTKIDDGSNNPENGTGIASIQTGASYPASNFIALYSIASGTPTDARVSVKSKLARTGQTPYRLCIIDQNGDETFLAFGANGTALVSTGASSIPSWQAPSVNIVGLAEKTSPVDNDLFVVSDSQDTNINKKVKQKNVFRGYFMYFGDGSDGNVTITTSVSLTRDMFYNNLTVNSPGVLNTNGYKVFVAGTLSGNGQINRNGNVGTVGASPGSGGAGGTALNQGTLGLCYAGGTGANGVTSANGGISTTGSTINDTYRTGTNNKGGNGGTSTNGGPGTGGQNTVNIGLLTTKSILDTVKYLGAGFVSKILYNTLGGGVGGASGGSGSNGTSGGGGGGGSTGGIILIFAKTITFTGTITATGGAGANAGTSTATSNYGYVTGGSGGGGGGSGGIVYLVGNVITMTSSTINVNGGSGGAGSAGVRALGSSYAGGGIGGAGGDGGYVIIEALTSYTAGTVTATGGTGGTGGNDTNGSNSGNGANGTNGSTIVVSL